MDPLNFRRFGEKNYRILMILAGAAAMLIFVSLAAFLFGVFSGGGNSGAVKQSVKSWNRENYSQQIQNVTLKMKVMPSQGHGVIEYMNWTNTENPEFQHELKKSGLAKYNSSYHLYSKDTSLKFATLAFNEDMVPVGDAQPKCVYVEWAPSSKWNKPSAYKPLSNLGECTQAKVGWWNENDPKVGVEVSNWWQNEIQISCSGKSCVDKCRKQKGWWVWKNDESGGTCYGYDILKSICLTMSRKEDKFGQEDWEFKGGCFQEGQPGYYERGVPGTVYHFEGVRIEVRGHNDPYVSTLSVTGDSAKIGGSGFNIFAWLCLTLGLLSAGGAVYYYRKLSASSQEYGEFS